MVLSKDFLWGGDISATQIEGAWNEDGKSPVETDYLLPGKKGNPRYAYYQLKNGKIGKSLQFSGQAPKGSKFILKKDQVYPNHFASDFYHHYKEDIALLAEMGFKALNITISWARILPNGIKGGVNAKGVDFYLAVLKELKKYNIKPIATLYKYDMPAFYITEFGGWSNRELISEYLAFCKICFNSFKDYIEYWVTFNEINILKLTLDGNDSASQTDKQRIFQEIHNQLVASAKAVQLGHGINPANKIGCMVCGLFTYPRTCNPNDVLASQKYMQDNIFLFSDVFVRGHYPSYAKRIFKEYNVNFEFSTEDEKDLRNGKADFLPFSYYFTNCVSGAHPQRGLLTGVSSADENKNPYLKSTEWDWQIDAKGLKYALELLNDRYDNFPLLIIENGIGAKDVLNSDNTIHDQYRIDYHRKHIKALESAVSEGVNLLGYTMWSCIDLVSAGTGELRKRYGFIYIDVNDDGTGTYKRYKKDSFYWYKKVIQTNGNGLD